MNSLLSFASVMKSVSGILLAVLILLVMVTIHEFGHYVAGKILKFQINEFSVGFGPALFKKRSKKTGEIFALRLIPLGGYCAFEGEDDWGEEESENKPEQEEQKQDVFENELLKNNKLLFSNPQLEITTKTNVGIPLRLRLENVYASKGDRIEKATFNGVDYAIEDLIIPEVPFDSATTTFTLNREYGSLHTLLSMLPEKINVDYKVTTPESTTNKSQFITLPLLAKLDVQAKVPLQFDPTTSFSYKDTLDADFSGLAENELLDMIDIDTISVFLDINSAIPANITLKLYYLDNLDQIITESDPITIQSALVNADGCVATPTQKTVTLHTTEEAIEDVLNTKKIIIEASLTGYDENSKIYFQSTNAIDIKVGAYLKAKASLSTSQIGTSN